jgi:CheY-like chemotaxis protein
MGRDSTAPSQQTVLIVEDNVDNLLIYSTMLEFAGFRVVSAKDGPAGLALARTEAPDIILMDVSIPGIDGWEVTRQLKADPDTSKIPILVLTAHALAGDRTRAFEVGADGYISKPADPRSVLAAVQRRLADPTFVVGQPKA